MKKNTLAAIFAAISLAGVGGAIAISQVDPSRITNATTMFNVYPVDLGKTVSRTELKTALSNAAKDIGWSINFTESYEKRYKLGSVVETSRYRWTDVNISSGPMSGIDSRIYGTENNAYLEVDPTGFISNDEIKNYLSAVSKHLPEKE